MGEASDAVRLGARTFALALLLAGCGQIPLKPSPAHVSADPAPRPEGAIPAPVQTVPSLPAPAPAVRPETYSVVVNNVRVQDLLFALARDARLNVDIHPGIIGSVTLNAIDQTLPQILDRMSKQVDMRYEISGQTLAVMRDVPYLRSYQVDYVSSSRNVTMRSTSSTQFAGAAGAAGGGASQGTGSTATIDVNSKNELWDALVLNLKDILRETDKIVQVSQPGAPAQPPAAGGAPAQPQAAAAPPTQPAVEFREAAAVIGNRESGVLFVRATSRQHQKVQEFLDQVLANVRRQVLIEATIAEVQLNNLYERGIDWQRLRPAGSAAGFTFAQSPGGTPAGVSSTSGFVLGYATGPALNVVMNALKLLESFGDVKVLSSPKISVLNNQTALLRVTRDIVYFTITPSTQPITVAGGGTGGVTVQSSFTTTPNVAAEGFMMSVLPQINEADTVVLNVRPSIRRRVDFAIDPNPALAALTPNRIPVFETREMDSILRIQSGQIAMLGGLMQDQVENAEDGIPGVRNIPGIGQLLSQRKDQTRKTELVIFLRATVIRDPSMEGDFRRFSDLLPGNDYFVKPNPQREQPAR
jgi:general secretion pathway protein D